jgi:hypothetical protein
VDQRNEGGTAGGVTAGVVSAGAVVVEVVDVLVTVAAPPSVAGTLVAVVEEVPVATGLGAMPHSASSFWISATVGLRTVIPASLVLHEKTRKRAAKLMAAETGDFQFMTR